LGVIPEDIVRITSLCGEKLDITTGKIFSETFGSTKGTESTPKRQSKYEVATIANIKATRCARAIYITDLRKRINCEVCAASSAGNVMFLWVSVGG
jgi:hypothetical protein